MMHLPKLIRRRCPLRYALVLLLPIAIAGCGPTDPGAPPDTAAPNAAEAAEAETGDNRPSDEPLVLRGVSGQTIRGRTLLADPSIVLQDCADITIIDCDLRRVQASGSSAIRIEACKIHDSADNGVYLDDCRQVLVRGNQIWQVRTGILAHRSQAIRVVGNTVRDVQGPLPGGQLVQFDKVTGPGNAILDNIASNARHNSQPEDVISIYQSHGTPDSPILIEGNYLAGDLEHGSAGKSDSGSGIMLGDGGGSWQLCRNNTLLSPGQVGIGVASGEDITVEGNLILGHRSDVANVGLYIWNQYDSPAGRVTVHDNIVAWVNAAGDDNPFWDGGGFESVLRTGNIFGGRALLSATPPPPPPAPGQLRGDDSVEDR